MKYALLFSLLVAGSAYADLESLDNQDMQQVAAQGGADLSWVLSLNHGINPDGSSTNTLSSNCITNYRECRLGISPNNRYDDGSYTTVNPSTGAVTIFEANGTTAGATLGKKLWLVFKGIQGTINLQQVGLDGADLSYTGIGGANVTKAAIQLTYDPTKPILIRNYGYQSLSVEMDTVDNEGATNVPGFWQNNTTGTGLKKLTNGKYDYSTSFTAGGLTYNNTSFDHGRESGFTGLNMHGNLVLGGSVKLFSCDATHPRCG